MSSDAVGTERISSVVGYKLVGGNFATTSPNLPQRIALIGEANEGKVRVEVNGNGQITDITVADSIGKEEAIELILIASNRALEQAERTKEMEMAQSTKGLIPGM